MFLVSLIFILCVTNINAYFTIPSTCPENVELQKSFDIEKFHGVWHQVYHYSSDEQLRSNCSSINIDYDRLGYYLNISRVDLGLFHRYSKGKIEIPVKRDDEARLEVEFLFPKDPRRLKSRKYQFYVLATDYDSYATVYTCSYSAFTNKHFIYTWILSRNLQLNDESKKLAIAPLSRIGVKPESLTLDDRSQCNPKYYEDVSTAPQTFRYAVPLTKELY